MPALRYASLSLAAAIVAGLLGTRAAAADTIGFASTPRPNQDNAAQYIGIVDQPFAAAGETVTSFSFYGTNPAATVAPILFVLTGNTFTVTTIGAPVPSSAGGAVSAPFISLSGSTVTTAATYGGFYSTGDTIPFTYTANPPGTALFVPFGPVTLGSSFGVPDMTERMDTLNSVNNRNYSFSITALASITAIPEPASLALLAVGIAGAAVTARRRRA